MLIQGNTDLNIIPLLLFCVNLLVGPVKVLVLWCTSKLNRLSKINKCWAGLDWLDGGKSAECVLAVNFRKGVGFRQSKWSGKSGIYHHTEKSSFTIKSSYDILMKNYGPFPIPPPLSPSSLPVIKLFCLNKGKMPKINLKKGLWDQNYRSSQ